LDDYLNRFKGTKIIFQLFYQLYYCDVNWGIVSAQWMRAHTFKLYVEYENVKALLFTCYKENDVQSTE
jgi:hypothetical protein